MTAPVPCVWDGEAFVPRRGFAKRCDEVFVVGETYRLEVVEERSAKSHAHYFACVKEGWQSLPEHLAEQFPSDTHLRKFLLIKAGFADSRRYVAGSRAEALRLAAFLKGIDEFSVVTIEGAVVTLWQAHTQNMKAMDRETFARSKDAVLGLLDQMLGVEPGTTGRQGEAA